jgi:nucleolar GTP-binding protein
MNFQKLLTVDDADSYLDQAFRAANKRAELVRDQKIRGSRLGRIDKSKNIEIEKLQTIQRTLKKSLNRILTSFPRVDDLPNFYRELLKVTLDREMLKKSLASVKWAGERIDILTNKQISIIKKAREMPFINKARRAYYGRTSSVLKQIDKHLAYIEGSRRIMKTYPDVKTDIKTIALCGLPNVGKSTLLKALTTSNPEIKAYPFTTKSLNIGYMKTEIRKFQIIDTPGTLDRPTDKTNEIEKQAYLTVKYVAEKVLFVFDPTETCGYTIEKQFNVFCKVLQNQVIVVNKLPVAVVINKADLEAERKEELLVKIKKKTKATIYEISAETGKGINEIRKEIKKRTKSIAKNC